MTLKFTKMHGLGNDFMVINGISQSIHLEKTQIEALSNRHKGVGFDQCLIIDPPQSKEVDFNYRIFNADGNEVGQCGNGARALALFAKHYGLTQKSSFTVATKTTRMQLTINKDNSVTVGMGIPRLKPKDIPLLMPKQEALYSLSCSNHQTIKIHAVNIGNPHALVLVDDLDAAPVQSLGQELSTHALFPEQVNAGFMQILNPEHIKLRVFERGSGETSACGSGAVAAAAIGRLYHQMATQIKVSLPGGDLIIDWPDINKSIQLTGSACFVYEGALL